MVTDEVELISFPLDFLPHWQPSFRCKSRILIQFSRRLRVKKVGTALKFAVLLFDAPALQGCHLSLSGNGFSSAVTCMAQDRDEDKSEPWAIKSWQIRYRSRSRDPSLIVRQTGQATRERLRLSSAVECSSSPDLMVNGTPGVVST